MWLSSLTLTMTLTLNFQGQIWNFLYLSQKWSDCHETKIIISIELKASNVTNGFDLHHNLDLWILKVKRDLDLWPHTWPWPWIFMVKFWNSHIPEWEGWLTLHKGGGSRLFMTMTITIWWPRSGVWIYQIVTGVTSVVGVPPTHLVSYVIGSGSVGFESALWMLIALSSHNTDQHIDGLVQERRNSSALAMELHLSCTNPSISLHQMFPFSSGFSYL